MMRKLISKIFNAYSRSFYVSIAGILAALFFIFGVRSFSDDVPGYSLGNTELLAEEIEEQLGRFTSMFDLYAKTIESTANAFSGNMDTSPESLERIFASAFWREGIENVFFIYSQPDSQQLTEAYFFDGAELIREEFGTAPNDLPNDKNGWIDISQIKGLDAKVAYVAPVKLNGHRVLPGITLDFERIVENVSLEREYGGSIFILDKNAGTIYSVLYKNPKYTFPSINDVVLNELQNGSRSGSVKTVIDGTAWIIAYVCMDNGAVLADCAKYSSLVKGSNDILYVLAASAVFCLWLVQRNKKSGFTPFERISEMLMKTYKDQLSHLEMNSNRAAHALHMGLVLTVVFYTFYAITVNATWTVLVVHTGVILLGCSTMMIYRKRAITQPKAILLVALTLLVPLAMHFFEGGFAYRNPGSSLLWIVSGILMALFLVGVTKARIVFAIFIVLLFLTALVEMTILKNHNYELIFSFISGLFFLGFSLYASIRTYILGSQEDYAKITELLDKLKASRQLEIQREKMATLGQLIAGVSHEINTPIGAIKASGENMNAAFYSNLNYVFEKVRHLTDEELELLIIMVRAARESMSKVKSTSELRKARRELTAYLKREGAPQAEEIAAKMALLEICDTDLVDSEKEMFRNERVSDVLDILTKLAPIITGTQTILMATGKVSKIVFALKSYSFMTGSDQRKAFDILASIDNILILHTNLLKSGITVVKNVEQNIPDVLGNADEIGQVWINLIHNAVYAMNGSGTLTIDVVAAENAVRVSVTDTGVGIEKENLHKIFDAFYTSKPVGEGTGLGLDICRKIIENHQGRIWVSSEMGKGTTFFIELPAAVSES